MNDDLHTLSGAYALHALPERDAALFEAHMSRCEACAVEVRGLSETAARLAVGAAEPPPRAMRARVMARIAEVRQEPPLVERRAAPPAPPGPFEEAEGAGRENVVPLRPASPRRRRIMTGLAAASTAAA
ncbi:zf-HC2 domain-containing protein, partial [Streptosporangium sp. NPDC048865]|uniref:zf-HC2 domain-containing protein n=1 Tax=Streptosporangium sp. NPDC048865 TaxID=3155766 RepID=UPI0034249F04